MGAKASRISSGQIPPSMGIKRPGLNEPSLSTPPTNVSGNKTPRPGIQFGAGVAKRFGE